MDMLEAREVYTFSPGPCIMPLSVQRKVQSELLNYNGTGVGLMEISHRSKEFTEINNFCINGIKQLIGVPDNYKIMLTQGGATTQNSAVPMNLANEGDVANYLVTGLWGKISYVESKKFLQSNIVSPMPESFLNIPDRATWQVNPNGKYFYYVDNETVDGLEIMEEPDVGMPLVCDMTSSLGSKRLDVSKYGVIFGSVQKNLGPAGVCVVIADEKLVGVERASTPQMLSWRDTLGMNSVLNTPPVMNVYATGLYVDFLQKSGGVDYYDGEARKRQKLIYDVLDGSHGFYKTRVVNAKERSRLNVVFYIDNEELQQQFLEEAKSNGLVELKGHPSTGGIRANMYNGMPMEGAKKLHDLLVDFSEKYRK